MFNVFKKEINWQGEKLTIETGKLARQCDGSVLVTYGKTQVLATAVAAKTANPEIDFFPLTVHFQTKTYAAGKIPGGFFKREAKPPESDTLTSRLIDRPIRPLFIDGFKNETQVICTVLGHDLDNSSDIVALIAASAALTISGLPFLGPIGAVRVGYKDGNLIMNPKVSEMKDLDLDLVVAGTQEGVLMVESEANELPENVLLDAVMKGHEAYQDVIQAIISLAEHCAKDPWTLPEPAFDADKIAKLVESTCRKALEKAYEIVEKSDRRAAIDTAKEALLEKVDDDHPEYACLAAFKTLEKDIVRGKILKTGTRIDKRDTKTVRPIATEIGLLPCTHGSALFTRGETQALVVATLGSGDDEQIIDALEGEYRENFMLHYNFPPYSVGEVGRVGPQSRREIGHGKLAWRALHPLLPSDQDFPYTLRLVSEITESNGSSSMATVCGSSLAMMDAGVPIKSPVAGIAMGLIKEGDDFAVLSDILGDEDHLGDMDFKVAGTEKGVTALQMDIKITSITEEIMKIALEQANAGRLHILKEMAQSISTSRQEVKENAPKIIVMNINKDKIKDVIGSGGKVIKDICERADCKVDISDDGKVRVSAPNTEKAEKARDIIQGIVAEPELGKIYEGKVVKVVDFGAFVNFLGPRDGLVHISELSDERPENISDVIKEGDIVKVKLIGFDNRGKVKLSMKQA